MIQPKRFVTGVAVAVFGAILVAAGLTSMPRMAAAAPGDMTLTGTIAYHGLPLEGGDLLVYAAPASTPCLKVPMRGGVYSFSFTIPSSASKSGCGVEGRAITLQYESFYAYKTNTYASPNITFTANTTAKVNVVVEKLPDPYPSMRINAKVIFAGAPGSSTVTIRAYVNGKQCGSIVDRPAPLLSVDVAAAERVPGCGKDGDPITFTVNDKPATAAPLVSFKTGGLANTTLTATP